MENNRTVTLLFQGDSITDCGRNREDPEDLGNGYPAEAVKLLQNRYGDGVCFINRGVGGDRTEDILSRSENDIFSLRPDIISILVGVNDMYTGVPTESFEANYRRLLTGIREKTKAMILLMEPFLEDTDENGPFRKKVDEAVTVVRRLAREYADGFLTTDALLASCLFRNPQRFYWTAEGVHPTKAFAEVLGERYASAVIPLIDSELHKKENKQ